MSVSPDALQERTRGARATLWRLVGPWWLFLLTAIAWLILAGVAQRFIPASIATVGVLLGFWASQQFLSVKGALLLVWVGLFALFRGISEIVIAFEVRGRQIRSPSRPCEPGELNRGPHRDHLPSRPASG